MKKRGSGGAQKSVGDIVGSGGHETDKVRVRGAEKSNRVEQSGDEEAGCASRLERGEARHEERPGKVEEEGRGRAEVEREEGEEGAARGGVGVEEGERGEAGRGRGDAGEARALAEKSHVAALGTERGGKGPDERRGRAGGRGGQKKERAGKGQMRTRRRVQRNHRLDVGIVGREEQAKHFREKKKKKKKKK